MLTSTKNVLVSGGSRGIGRGVALSIAQTGSKVVLTYNKNEALALEVIDLIISSGGYAIAIEMDVGNRRSIQTALKTAAKKLGGSVDILVNNAAIAQEKPFETITDSDWQSMLRVNLQGPFMITQELLPLMKKKKYGRIINITSIGGQWGGYNQVHYAASKAALINFTQSIAKIYSKDGITSNAVAIGLVNTDMSRSELDSDEGMKKVESIPIGRVATVQEIADTVKFLASDGASYITGQTINLNGGMLFG